MRVPSPPSWFKVSVPGLLARGLAVALTGLVLFAVGCDRAQVTEDGVLTTSGFIEGQEVVVASEVRGLVSQLLVERGDRVYAGDLVARLDDASLQDQLAEAEAARSAARADLDRLLAGARREEMAAARAELAAAEAERDGARRAVVHAREVISRPLSLQAQIDEARNQVALAEQNVELQEADLEETRIKHGVYEKRGDDVARSWGFQLQAAEARLAEAEAELRGASSYVDALRSMRENPLSQRAQLHRAEADLEQAQAGVAAAEARLDELEAGPTDEEVALAEARVRQASAGVEQVLARLDQLTLRAPMDGIVSTRSAQVGEIAAPGAPLLTIANLDEVTLKLYISADRIGRVQVGQRVEVSVDTFPERVFDGRVASIAGEAEFTPQHIQTEEERVSLVFAVDVRIPNPEHALKPGLPADATLMLE